MLRIGDGGGELKLLFIEGRYRKRTGTVNANVEYIPITRRKGEIDEKRTGRDGEFPVALWGISDYGFLRYGYILLGGNLHETEYLLVLETLPYDHKSFITHCTNIL